MSSASRRAEIPEGSALINSTSSSSLCSPTKFKAIKVKRKVTLGQLELFSFFFFYVYNLSSFSPSGTYSPAQKMKAALLIKTVSTCFKKVLIKYALVTAPTMIISLKKRAIKLTALKLLRAYESLKRCSFTD